MSAHTVRDDGLAGRVAVISGGASGIGVAYAAEGADLVLPDINGRVLESLADGLSTSARPTLSVADLTEESDVDSLVKSAVAALGGVDVLVNAEGILTEIPLVDMDTTTWRRMIDDDLTSVFLTRRRVVPVMLEGNGSRIVNIAFQLGQKGREGVTHYCAAKAGVIGFTKALAREVSPRGILVNAIAPGPIETPLIDGMSADWKRTKAAELPLGRFGLPSEVAPTAVLLASDPGGNLYTGQTLGPNSGDVMV